MDFGFFSLIPPLVAILLAIVTRRVVIPLAVGVAVGAVILSLGRVELRTDLNTDGEVLVRIVAPSPWLSGERFFLSMQSMDLGSHPLSVVSFESKVEGGYYVLLNSLPEKETRLGELIEELEKRGCLISLEAGDPDVRIGGNFDKREVIDCTESWKVFSLRDGNLFMPTAGFLASISLFYHSMIDSIFSISHLQALIFSLLLAAMVGTLEVGGSMRQLIRKISKRIRTRRAAQGLIATSGLAVFFDDYANTLLLGGTMRSTADRYKISREKLAYFVDSTAAPVAGIALISTWTAVEISYLSDGLVSAGIGGQQAAFELFLHSIPYRFYPWLALVMVFTVAYTQRDFGPMYQAEVGASTNKDTEQSETDEAPMVVHRGLWLAAIVPVLLCLVSVLIVLMVTGTRQLKLNNEFDINQSTITQLGQVFGNGDSYLALVVGGAVGLLAAIGLHVALGVNFRECRRGAIHGAKQMMPAMVILWFAWALSGMTEKDALNTGGYLTGLLSGQLPVSLLPTVVFLLSALMAFATGTSWGTMGILTPVSVGLAVQLDYAQTDPLASAIVLATSGSVLAGAIFGDHCSPISDTTVLSSRASGCEHLSHVKTQFPYAMIVGGVCVGLGTIPAAFGVSPWICLLIGTVVIISVVTAFGKRVNEC